MKKINKLLLKTTETLYDNPLGELIASTDVGINSVITLVDMPDLTLYSDYVITLFCAYGNDGQISFSFIPDGKNIQMNYLRPYIGGTNNDVLMFVFRLNNYLSTSWQFYKSGEKTISNTNVVNNNSVGNIKLYKVIATKI